MKSASAFSDRPTTSLPSKPAYASAQTESPLARVYEGRFESPVAELPDGFRDIDAVVADFETQPGGAERMERARLRLSQRLDKDEQPSLARLRLARGLSQARLGRLIGVPQSQIATYESGRQLPGAQTLVNLADALKVSTDDVLAALGVKPSLRETL